MFNPKTNGSAKGISCSLRRLNNNCYPVIVCVGSDLVVGDSLGPYIGTELSKRLKGVYIYGTHENPITAKETEVIYNTVKKLHPKSQILVVDAAVGDKKDIGLIKVTDRGIKPGLGANKDLSILGDISIIGIVAEKQPSLNNLFYQTRFSLIYSLSQTIINGIVDYFNP